MPRKTGTSLARLVDEVSDILSFLRGSLVGRFCRLDCGTPGAPRGTIYMQP
jgi:hypothetical protein